MSAVEPLVSVVIPTRDRPERLRRAVDAVMGQRYRGSIECLVVFDQMRPEQGLEDSRPGRTIRVLANERTPGAAGARNMGYLAAQGEFIATCDDDDEWLPDKLAKQLALTRRVDDAAVLSCGIRVHSGDRSIDRPLPKERLTRADFLRSRVMEVTTSTLVARRDVFDVVGLGDERFAFAQDFDWLLRVTEHFDVFGVAEPLVTITWHAGSYFTDHWREAADAKQLLLEKHPDLHSDRRGAARLYGQLAVAHAALEENQEAASWIRRAFLANALEPRTYIALAVRYGLVSAGTVSRMVRRFGHGI